MSTEYKKGDRVLFGRRTGEKTLAEVVKVNPSRLRVKTLEQRGSQKDYPVGSVWNMAKGLCVKVDATWTPDQIRQRAVMKSVLSNEIARQVRPKRTEVEIISEIGDVYCQLSPENLTCDGELSHNQVIMRQASLYRQLNACFLELGREITEEESYGPDPGAR